MVSGGILTRSVIEQRSSQLSVTLARVFHLSESGLDVAIQALRTDPDYTGASYTELGNRLGGYAIEVVPEGPSRRIIRSTGFYPENNPAAFDYAARTIEAVVQMTKGAGPGYGVLGVRSVRFDGWGHDGTNTTDDRTGMTVDSYDSRQGAYVKGSSASLRVCTNANEPRAVTLIGGVTINGDVLLGPGSDPQTTLWRVPEKWNSISGTVSVADVGLPVESVEMPVLPDGGQLSISGHEVVSLPGGLYRFHDMQIAGHGRLVFTGPAEVYVEEDVRISGNGEIDTAAQLPTNLALYVRGAQVSISGDASLFAKLIAPDATVEISGNGDLYGPVIGREIVVHGRGEIHYDAALNLYDEALNSPRTGDPLQTVLLSWREVEER